jgi:DNA-binding MarR family transcriptional regulator
MENKEWYEQQELADEWKVPVARVRQTVASLESAGAIKTRVKPADRRVTQIHKSSIETLRKGVIGS